ncbi:MAG: NAD(P)-dependent oxidoreductase [Phycisphaerales bacterium]
MPPFVIQTEDLDPEPASWLAERCEFVVCPHDQEARLAELLPRADGLVVRTYTLVNRALLAKAPKLRVVGRAGVALENIDIPACRERGIEVVHTPSANTRAVVEYVSAIIADATRPRLYLDAAVPPAQWHQLRRDYLGARELNEMTLGIWGFGKIGSAIARVAAAMDMRVIYNDLLEIPPGRRSGAEPVPVDRLLAESDILSVHVDFREQNRDLVNAAALARCKPGLLFLNTSRGFVVDAAALAAFLRNNPGATAMIDVHDPHEPIPAGYPLLGLPNARLSPHLASGTTRAKRNMSWVVRDVWRVLNGEKPEFPAPAV